VRARRTCGWRSEGEDLEVVEGDAGLPAAEGEVPVGGAGERIGVVVGEDLLAVELPPDRAVLAGDDEVVALAGLDLERLGGAAIAAVLVAADDGAEAVAPTSEDD